MFRDQLASAIADAPSSRLDEFSRIVWQGVCSGALSEDDAGSLAEVIHARHALAKATSAAVGSSGRRGSHYPPRKAQRPPERSVAIERRRRLAASGPMPPQLASRFTTSELAVLRIVADEVRQRGSCRLYLDAIAARAGTSRSSAKNAIRQARRLGFIEVAERRQHGAKSLSNVITIIDREWSAWLKRGPGIGGRKFAPTDSRILSEGSKTAPAAQNLHRQPGREQPVGTRRRWQSQA